VKLHSVLRELFALLAEHEVDFVVVGGRAVAFHGFPRFTGDGDLFVRPSRENAARILAALAQFGFDETGLTRDDLTAPDTMVQLGCAPNRIDVLTR
jgi:hypothetical protein